MLSDVCLSDVCLSRTSGLSRERRGLRRLKLAQTEVAHVTRDSGTTFKVKRWKVNLQKSTCDCLPHSLFELHSTYSHWELLVPSLRLPFATIRTLWRARWEYFKLVYTCVCNQWSHFDAFHCHMYTKIMITQETQLSLTNLRDAFIWYVSQSHQTYYHSIC